MKCKDVIWLAAALVGMGAVPQPALALPMAAMQLRVDIDTCVSSGELSCTGFAPRTLTQTWIVESVTASLVDESAADFGYVLAQAEGPVTSPPGETVGALLALAASHGANGFGTVAPSRLRFDNFLIYSFGSPIGTNLGRLELVASSIGETSTWPGIADPFWFSQSLSRSIDGLTGAPVPYPSAAHLRSFMQQGAQFQWQEASYLERTVSVVVDPDNGTVDRVVAFSDLVYSGTATVLVSTPVPEPHAGWLAAAGLAVLGLAGAARRTPANRG